MACLSQAERWAQWVNESPANPAPTFSFTVDPAIAEFNIRPTEYLSAHPEYDALGTGALVFDAAGRVLLIQRSACDSMPNRWEVPGGGCDADDPTIPHGAARELWEEAGLVAMHVGRQVGRAHVFFSRRGLRICKTSFVVEVQGEGQATVKLDPGEHQAFVWASEEEVRRGLCGDAELIFTTEEQEAQVLEGFSVWREMKGLA